MLKNTTPLSILLVGLLALTSACTKKREESFVQGQGKDLIVIADLDGKVFDVETLDEIQGFAEKPVTTKSDGTISKSKFSNWNINPVKIKTDATLVGDVPFLAKPNTKQIYKVKYGVTNDYLIVYKLAKQSDLHPSEIPGAIQEGNSGLLAVPLVGYPVVGFFNTENQKSGEESTHKVIEMAANDKANAKFMKLKMNGRIIYKLQEKQDLFAKEYFQGEWYYAETLVEASKFDHDYVGFALNETDQQDLTSSTKLRFSFTSGELKGLGSNVDKRYSSKDEVYQKILLRIPVDHKEFRPTRKGLGIDLTEEEVTNLAWDKRKYVKINFEKLASSSLRSSDIRLVDLELDDNYFSFTVHEGSYNLRIKYSFLRDQGRKAYTPKVHFDKDFEKFGFFTTKLAEEDTFEKYRKADYEKNKFINRYNVANGEIRFYFTANSDEKLIPYAVKAVQEWDKAFKKAGVNVNIVADTSKKVALGDLRYNAINLIKTVGDTQLFGFGPSITDPNTGEIISATTNMHVTTLQSALVDHIRDYMLFKSGKTREASIFSQLPELRGNSQLSGQKQQVVRTKDKEGKLAYKVIIESDKKYFLPKMPVEVNGQVVLAEVEVKSPADKKMVKTKNWGREFDLGLSARYLNNEVETQCPDVVKLAVKMKESSEVDPKETEVIVACSEKLLPGKMMGTLLHELGHNFGLRHNFYASTDYPNFLTPEEMTSGQFSGCSVDRGSKIKQILDSTDKALKDKLVRSSSVMEYTSFNDDRLTMVGPYDVAAIRYGYGDQIETEDCKLVKLNTKKSINDNLASQQARNYKFCTDEDVELGLDPMCARHDSGATATEIVRSLINEYNASIAKLNYRYDRAAGFDPYRVARYRVNRFWIPLKQFYDEWRFKLVDSLGAGNEYLDNFNNQEAYKQRIAELIAKSPEMADYKQAATEIFRFGLQVATLPPRYCIGERNGVVAAIEFGTVRKAIYNNGKKMVVSCKDQDAVAHITEKYKFTPLYETGYELDNVRYNMDPKASKEPYDIIGLMPEKEIAVVVLTARVPLAITGFERGFYPNFLDEVDYRDEMMGYLADRLSKGINVKRLLKTNISGFLEKFSVEKRYVSTLVSSVFYDGLEVPEKESATRARKAKFHLKYTDKKDIVDKAIKKVLAPDGTNYYVIVKADATEAIKLLEKLESLPERIASAVPVTDETFAGLIDIAKVELDVDSKLVNQEKLAKFLWAIMEDEFGPGSLKRSEDQKKKDRHRVHWKKLFSKELAHYREILQGLASECTESSCWNAASSASVGETVAYKMDDVYGRLKSLKDGEKIQSLLKYNLDQKTLQARVDEYVSANKSKNGVESNDTYEYDELQAQYDMVLGLLRRMIEW